MNRPNAKLTIEKVAQYAKDRMSVPDVAYLENVAPQTVREFCKRHNIELAKARRESMGNTPPSRPEPKIKAFHCDDSKYCRTYSIAI